MAMTAKVYAKKVEYQIGPECMGLAKQSVAAHAEIEVTPIGAKVTSKKTSKTVLVPWGNIKACELMPTPKSDEAKE
jgi:hypothetical protein